MAERYLAAPQAGATAAQRAVQHSIYCIPSFIQPAAEVALKLPKAVVDGYGALSQRHRDRPVQGLNRMDGISRACPPATVAGFQEVGGDDQAVACERLDILSIAALSGNARGPAGASHLRLSPTCSYGGVEEASSLLSAHWGQQG